MPIEVFIALTSIAVALVAENRQRPGVPDVWEQLDAETDIVDAPDQPSYGPFPNIQSAENARDMKEMEDETACDVVKTVKGDGFEYWVVYAD